VAWWAFTGTLATAAAFLTPDPVFHSASYSQFLLPCRWYRFFSLGRAALFLCYWSCALSTDFRVKVSAAGGRRRELTCFASDDPVNKGWRKFPRQTRSQYCILCHLPVSGCVYAPSEKAWRPLYHAYPSSDGLKLPSGFPAIMPQITSWLKTYPCCSEQCNLYMFVRDSEA
jgi:hypothetical protein